jgi:hypothetical protein
MGILDRLFPGTPKPPGPEQEISRIIDRFTTATIMGIDREDLGRYPAKQYKVMAFHYGAIEYLAGQYGLEELQTLGLFVAFLDKYFNLPVTETGSIAERLQGFRDDPAQQRFLAAGVDIFRRWHEHNERRAPLELGVMLKDA